MNETNSQSGTEDEEVGRERIQFTCIDCGKKVDREPLAWDVPGLTPQRCIQCTLGLMAEGWS